MIVVCLFIICAILAALVVADYWMHHGKIYPDVSVIGIDLGGKTPEEAQDILGEQTDGPEEFNLTADKLGVNFDAQATANQAYAVGRQGSILKRISERIEAVRGTVYVPLTVNYEREQMREGLSDVVAALTTEPVEAGFEVSVAADTFELGRAKIRLESGEEITIYSPERSMVDAMRLRNQVGAPMWPTRPFRRYLRRPGVSPGDLCCAWPGG